MLKRIFNNLFSNILKYGEKAVPVSLSLTIEEGELKIQLKNKVKKVSADIESNHIGLKKCGKNDGASRRQKCFDSENDSGVYRAAFVSLITFRMTSCRIASSGQDTLR